MTLLKVSGLSAYYGDVRALNDVNLDIDAGEVVALIGANGAGKSTLLKSICGWVPVASEMVQWLGEAIGGDSPRSIVRRGVAIIPEGRRLFPSLTVEENLMTGRHSDRKGTWSLDRIYRLCPVLKERRGSPGTALSGGEQQMVAIGRALMTNPKLLLCDELSLGLSPAVIGEIYDMLLEVIGEGTSIVLVEQDLARATKASSRLYCLRDGRVRLEGRSSELAHEDIVAAYFGNEI